MIPKPLSEIEWPDIEALRDSGREEDDTIEYKSSFSGGSDFLAFTDPQRVKAIEGIAREAIAFLNGRGGDIVIGVKEAANDHPKIEEITPVSNIDQTVDRLAQSLAALIEPSQSVLALRAVRQEEGATDGVIVVRCQSSLRAPHRFKSNNVCYMRRGRASEPMQMDEVQDLTLRRAEMMTKRLELLDAQFSDLCGNQIGRRNLDAHRIHIRACFVPSSIQQIELTEEVLNAFRGDDPCLYYPGDNGAIRAAFNTLSWQYRPVLRGMMLETRQQDVLQGDDLNYCSMIIRSDGMLRTDYACRSSNLGSGLASQPHGFFSYWFAGYLARTLTSFAAVQRLRPSLGNGILRVVVYCEGTMTMVNGNYPGANFRWPNGTIAIPDFDIVSPEVMLEKFEQLQLDIAHIPGLQNPRIYRLSPAQ